MFSVAQRQELSKHLNSNEIDGLESVFARDDTLKYFLRTKTDPKWFYPLKILGCFEPDKAPSPIPANEKGYFTVPAWDVLDYLVAVAQAASNHQQRDIGNELIAIIERTTHFHSTEGREFDNFRTGWYFAKILTRLPPGWIPMSTIALAPVWMASKFDHSLTASDLGQALLPRLLSSDSKEDWAKAEELFISFLNVHSELTQAGKARFLVEPFWLRKIVEKTSPLLAARLSLPTMRRMVERIERALVLQRFSAQMKAGGEHFFLDLFPMGAGELNLRVSRFNGATETELLTEQVARPRSHVTEVFQDRLIGIEHQSEFPLQALRNVALLQSIPGVDAEGLRDVLSGLYRGVFRAGAYDSFFEADDYKLDDAESVFRDILKLILPGWVDKHLPDATELLAQLWKSNFHFLKKATIFGISESFGALGGEFWRLFERESTYLLTGEYASAELHHLFKVHAADFPKSREQMVRGALVVARATLSDRSEEERHLWEQRWCFSLRSCGDFARRYEELRALTGVNLDKERSYRSGWVGPGKSPLTKDEIVALGAAECVRRINAFSPIHDWDAPSVDGLSAVLRTAFAENPEIFFDHPREWATVGYRYAYEMLRGLETVVNGNAQIFPASIEFMRLLVSREGFGTDLLRVSGDDHRADASWVIGGFADLLGKVPSDVDSASRDAALAVLMTWFSRLPADTPEKSSDLMTFSLNTWRGRCIRTVVLLGVTDKRNNAHEGGSGILSVNFLKSEVSQGSPEAAVTLGQYLNYIPPIEPGIFEWIAGNLQPEVNNAQWRGFLEGHSYSDSVVQATYSALREHFEVIIKLDDGSKDIPRLVEHVAISYLRGHEGLQDESIFARLIRDGVSQHVVRVINFFWEQRSFAAAAPFASELQGAADVDEKFRAEVRNRILEFWRFVHECLKVSKRPPAEVAEWRGDLLRLAVFFPELDCEATELLMASVPFIGDRFNAHYLIEALDSSKAFDSSNGVGKIFRAILDYTLPDFDPVHIRSVVDYLFVSGEYDVAKEICEIYAGKGNLLLRDVFRKHYVPER